ncbi:MAG: carbohydrate ABC transporter substrate-binding protein [Clostridia bacterium]|nr:carbohydrate ABC transporter substrate-binding protein [Clostridia bacterium]MBQ4608033.1 carbohydrate ABC transporter substrate-binding protein [Clostridia bacterium]MBQ6859518.1 carbohydrate ABC transporter substrate-binding protein [Clostridia bacterium]
MKKLIACVLTLVLAVSAVGAMAEGLTFSWWGGDARHEATQAAVAAFTEATGVTVENTYSAWSGWEDKMSQYFASDSAFDVNQVNWNWLFSFVDGEGKSKMYDLNQVADIIDLTQFADAALAQCTVNGELLAIPVSMTGRIFYWNETTWQKAGLETPKTLAELMAAGQIFAEKLGDEYYPLALGTYDKMILMVHYLECKYGTDWVTDNKLNYTVEQIAEGVQFIQDLEDAHVIPSAETLIGDGADSLDKNPKWMDGVYAGIWEWDSSASKFGAALSEGQNFVVGEYFTDIGEFQGGFTKVSLALCIANSAADKQTAAQLIEFLLNSDEGARLMNSQRGIPLSAKANALCQAEGLLDPMVAEANGKVIAWCKNGLDPQFEAAALKNSDGVYADAFDGLSYGDYDVEEAAEVLVEGINEVLGA